MQKFQSTRPIRGATVRHAAPNGAGDAFQSTRPIRGATYRPACARPCRRANFNPRAPYGARLLLLCVHLALAGFQSTRPIRGATCRRCLIRAGASDFNPRAPYGARPASCYPGRAGQHISIHAPHTGRDDLLRPQGLGPGQFQSTRPIRGATRGQPVLPRRKRFQSTRPIRGATCRGSTEARNPAISIHAPHTGRDLPAGWPSSAASRFQSTRPIRGAT